MGTATPATQQPPAPSLPFVGSDGAINPIWYSFLVGQYSSNSGNVNSLAQVLPFFQPQPPNQILASPNGADGEPAYRSIATGDLTGAEGQFPGTTTNDSATAGNVGEYIFDQILIGAAVPLVSTDPIDIATIELSPGDWDVWASVATTGSGALSTFNAWANTVSEADPGAPNGGLYLVSTNGQPSPMGLMRLSLAEPATVYLSMNATFTGTVQGYGFLGARRAR